jgi:hypothetical protein
LEFLQDHKRKDSSEHISNLIVIRHSWIGYLNKFDGINSRKKEVTTMTMDALNIGRITIGTCMACGKKTIIASYEDEGFCTECIEKDEHLNRMIGWQ